MATTDVGQTPDCRPPHMARCSLWETLSMKTLALALLLTSALASSTGAQAQQSAPPAGAAKPAPVSPFVPSEFDVPTLLETANFKMVPLGPDVVKIDFDAYMSSIDHLQKTFTRSSNWPTKDISAADAMRDMEAEQARFKSRRSFAYAVLTPDGRRERGSVYVSPSPVDGYDAVVRLWVSKADYDAGFDAELYAWVIRWVQRDWPFRNVAYPGRSIEWKTWDALIAADSTEKAAPGAKTP
jgi:hypothetical protein